MTQFERVTKIVEKFIVDTRDDKSSARMMQVAKSIKPYPSTVMDEETLLRNLDKPTVALAVIVPKSISSSIVLVYDPNEQTQAETDISSHWISKETLATLKRVQQERNIRFPKLSIDTLD